MHSFEAPSDSTVQAPNMFNGIRRFAGRVGLVLAVAAGPTIIGETFDGPSAQASASSPIAVVGMPFTGKWAWNGAAVHPDVNGNYNDNTSSHPSVHHRYYGDWATDLYAGAGTAVKLHVTSPDGPVTFSYNRSNDSCSSAGPNIAGHGIALNVLVNGTSIGSIDYEHLDNIPPTNSAFTNGMTIGNVTSEALDPSCYSARHTHIELKNVAHYACWTDHGYPGDGTIVEGTSVGEIGSANAGPQQVCSDGGSGGSGGGSGTNVPDRPSVLYNPGNGLPAIAARAAGNILKYYFQRTDGSFGQVNLGEADSGPSLAFDPNTNLPVIAVQGPNQTLQYYYQRSDGSFGNANIGQAYSTPNLLYNPTTHLPAITVEGPANATLYYFQRTDGSWGSANLGAGYSSPDLAFDPNTNRPVVAVEGPSNSLYYYYQRSDGSFGQANLGSSVVSAPSLKYNPGSNLPVIAVGGSGNVLDYYYQRSDGSWGMANLGDATSAPDVVYNPSSHLPAIAVQGLSNTLQYYYQRPDGSFGEANIGSASAWPNLAFNPANALPVIVDQNASDTLQYYFQRSDGSFGEVNP